MKKLNAFDQILFISKFFVLTNVVRATTYPCPPNNYTCNCSKGRGNIYHTADCSNKNLTQIPNFHEKYQRLVFTKNILHNLSIETFKPVEKLNLSELVISHCGIHSVDVNTFSKLQRLSLLDISYNAKLQLNTFWNSIKTLNVTSLELSGLPFKNATDFDFSKFLLKNLKTLILRDCQIKTIPKKVLLNFEMLETLDLSRNNLEEKALDLSIYRTANLSLSNCNITKFPIVSTKSEIRNLNISHNQLKEFDIDTKLGVKLPALDTLSLESNPIQKLPPTAFQSLKSLAVLHLENITTKSFTFRGIISESLTVLYLNRSTFLSRSSPNVFQQSTNIQDIYFSFTDLKDWTNNELTSMFKPIWGSLKRLYLQNAGLSQLPNRAFCFQGLNLIDLSFNNISTWDEETFSNATIYRIKLHHNNIQVLNKSSFSMKIWDNIRILDVHHNPISCTCDLHWFREWIRGKYYKLDNYGKRFTCYSPKNLKGTEIVDYDPTLEDCFPLQPSMILAITICTFCLIVVPVLNCFVKPDDTDSKKL